MSRPQRVSLSQGWCRRQPLYQNRRNEIWCNVMWWWSMLEMLPGIETDRIWISTTLITTTTTRQRHSRRQTHGRHARLPVYLSVCICAIWWSPPKGIIKGTSNTRRSISPWEEAETVLGGRWKNWRRLSSLQQCLPYSGKDPVSSLVQPSATHIHFIQHYRFMISHTHTHVITHAAL